MESRAVFKLAVVMLMTLLLNDIETVRALTADEISQFGARTHVDPNTGVQGYITITDYDTDNYLLSSNGIPDHTAGPWVLPDRSDNVVVQNFQFYIPKSPTASTVKYDLPFGPIGLGTNGVALFNPYSAVGEDAMIYEASTFDDCDGHPTPNGVYHYHGSLKCVFDLEEGVPSDIVGVALDGFPVYGPNDENGNRLYSEDLDQCHGRYVDGAYRYHVTDDFPYILGCFHGAVDSRNTRNPRPGQNPPPNSPGGDMERSNPTGRATSSSSSANVAIMAITALVAFLHYIYFL